jgi:GAF domain-containing protein
MDSQALQKTGEALRMIKEISRALNNEGETSVLLDMIVDRALRHTRAERGFLVLKEPSGAIDILAARQLNKAQVEHPTFKVSRGVIDEVLRTAQPVILENAKDDPMFAAHQSVVLNKPMSLACLPLKLKGGVAGALYLDSRLRTGLFPAGDTMVLEMFADLAATAIQIARLTVQLRMSGRAASPAPAGERKAAAGSGA